MLKLCEVQFSYLPKEVSLSAVVGEGFRETSGDDAMSFTGPASVEGREKLSDKAVRQF